MATQAGYSFDLLGEGSARILSEFSGREYWVHFLGEDFVRYSFREIFESRCYDIALDVKAPIIVDAGANVGLATIFFHDRWPTALIYALEPGQIAFQALEANISRNLLNRVRPVRGALWDRSETTSLYVDENHPGRLRHSCFTPRWSGTPVHVKAAPLFEWVDEGVIDLLKLDIEGAETRVINQLVESDHLGRIRHLIVEFHHQIGIGESLGNFLLTIEKADFAYQIQANTRRCDLSNSQDVLIYAKASARAHPRVKIGGK